MFDSCKRQINYLRVSVTDRCNLRCVYCMPAGGIRQIDHNYILSYEEIADFVRIAAGMGITKVRITGGEPLVRKGVTGLVGMIAAIPGITDLSMTTNGMLLGSFAEPLKEAGLHRVNVSLDTVDPERYRQLTRGGDIKMVFRGIEAAINAGLWPVKINCVIRESSDEPDACSVRDFCRQHQLQARFIRQMHLTTGQFSVVDGGDGGNCAGCNRLRLTADGRLKPCLFSDIAYDIKSLGPHEALILAVRNKPDRGTVNCSGHFYNIGG